ncbi:carbohydrate-binding domain-containing protein [Actinoplanes sp. G11-F43]|uniref:carbohydrate-binding domain-containing protein n=1 Tax=Actinoplanes sp. G11-F43 TaxID=3424130 RepID=UPI003D34BC29
MRIRRKVLAAVSSLALAAAMLAGCSTSSGDAVAATPAAVTSTVDGTQNAAAVLAADKEVHSAGSDEAGVTGTITLTGASATSGAEGVTVDGNTVTITAAGTYTISGELAGQIVVNAPDATVTLILDGAAITSTDRAAIAATEVKELVVQLAAGSANTLADTTSYATDADVDAALFSAGDLTVNGDGKLTVTGNANDAIAAKDGLLIESGTISVTAKDDGIRGKDYVVVTGGTITVTAGGDGIKADNDEDTERGYVSVSAGTITVTSGGDGVDAATDVVVTGGTITVTSGGGLASAASLAADVSAKGLKSGVITVLEGGTVAVNAADDAVHSDGAIHLNGAKVTVGSGDDGVHAEGQLIVDAGSVTVASAVEGLEAAQIVLNDGSVSVTTSDDGVNATSSSSSSSSEPSVTVNGGTLVINADGDGLDSNGTASITGGTVVVNGPEGNGNGALDVDATFTISGGILLAAGSSGMAVTPDAESAQAWLSATVDSAIPAGTTIQITDSDGTVVGTFTTSKSTQNITYSSPAVKPGGKYTISTGGTASGTVTGGLAASGTLGSATQVATVTAGSAPAGGGRGFGRR